MPLQHSSDVEVRVIVGNRASKASIVVEDSLSGSLDRSDNDPRARPVAPV